MGAWRLSGPVGRSVQGAVEADASSHGVAASAAAEQGAACKDASPEVSSEEDNRFGACWGKMGEGVQHLSRRCVGTLVAVSH